MREKKLMRDKEKQRPMMRERKSVSGQIYELRNGQNNNNNKNNDNKTW